MLVDVADIEVVEEPAAPTFLHRHPDLLSELASDKHMKIQKAPWTVTFVALLCLSRQPTRGGIRPAAH
jgi:hypothetical protein